jgi:hypothetical protein
VKAATVARAAIVATEAPAVTAVARGVKAETVAIAVLAVKAATVVRAAKAEATAARAVKAETKAQRPSSPPRSSATTTSRSL